jgi:ketosteroid isomerase-like protein
MKKKSRLLLILMAVGVAGAGCNDSHAQTKKTLYDTIAAMDARWEDAYNNCKLDVMEEIINEDLEFYHDRGGLMTSKQKLNEALKVNICGKVTRILKKGSIEVSPIPGFGAVEIGLHGFRNVNEPNADVHYSRFVHVWKRDGDRWSITRVISLH